MIKLQAKACISVCLSSTTTSTSVVLADMQDVQDYDVARIKSSSTFPTSVLDVGGGARGISPFW